MASAYVITSPSQTTTGICGHLCTYLARIIHEGAVNNPG